VTVTRTNGTTSLAAVENPSTTNVNETIQYQTADITAADGTNYLGTAGALTLTPTGPDTQTFTVTTINTGQTSDLGFLVILKHPNNTFLGAPFLATVDLSNN
jgi:hypothetical protein